MNDHINFSAKQNAAGYRASLDDVLPVATVILRLEDGETVYLGGTLLRDLGYTDEDFDAFQKKRMKGLVHPEDYGTAFQEARSRGEELPPLFEQEYRVIKKNGDVAWLYEKGRSIDLSGGEKACLIVCMDITATRSKKDDEFTAIRKRAETDGMTGLYNKATAEALIRRRLSDRSSGACVLLIVDLDDLKAINDTLGHAQGDLALRKIADVLKTHFRRTDIVGRMGGDEFIAYLDGMENKAMADGVLTALRKKLDALRIGEKQDIPLHGSIGVTLGAPGGGDFETLCQQADKALYYVKRNGKNGYAFYSSEMEDW